MKRALAVAVGMAAVSFIAPAVAGKVSMPKEGPYELKFCTIGSGTTVLANDQAYVTHYSGAAVLNALPPGGAFDRQAAKCWGTLGIVKGKASHLGYCDLVDMDGDKWLMEYHGKEDNSGGTYVAVFGTGKYDGMTLKGEYKLDFYPGPGADGYSGCHHNKGTYKLK
jgi:hypothetical protein